MTDIQIFSNPQFGEIRITISEDDKPMFCLADVCKALELKNPSDVKTRLSSKGVAITDTLTAGGVQSMTYINEANLYKCIFQSRKPDAEKFQDWVCEEVLPSIGRTGAYISPNAAANAKLQEAEVKVYLVEAISRNLRLNEASRLGMYQSIVEPYGLSIPQYVPSEGVMKSASVLLKEINSGMSVIKFNQLLEKNGYIETIARPTTGGKPRNFKNITEKGASYGQNMQNPKNQKETQPLWFADKFRKLYEIVTNISQL